MPLLLCSTVEFPEQDFSKRVSKIRAWLVLLEEAYEELRSEAVGHSSREQSGFDPEPQKRPCEHRRQWKWGQLCVACDNTGWRPLTQKERDDGLGIDPYAAQLPKTTTGVVLDESRGARQARELARLSAAIEALERNSRIRDGLEVRENVELRLLRRTGEVFGNGRGFLRRLQRAMSDLPSDLGAEERLFVLAATIPGRIPKRPIEHLLAGS